MVVSGTDQETWVKTNLGTYMYTMARDNVIMFFVALSGPGYIHKRFLPVAVSPLNLANFNE